MPSLTLARTGQISEPQECGPGTRITTTGSGYVEWTSGTLADVRNGVATWQRWPGGSAGDYCDTLRRLVFRGVASGSGFVVTWDEGKADPGPEGVYWQEQASSGSPVDAREFGVKADGVTDDTAALQAAVTAATTGGGVLMLPAGTIRITAAITIGFSQGWKILGQGRERTTIKQATDNTPIFRLTASLTHGWTIQSLRLSWVNQQSDGGTHPNSVCVYFDGHDSATMFNFVLQDIIFERGFRGVAINPASNQVAIWGVMIRDCVFSRTLMGAGLRAQCNAAVGQPNIQLENIYIDAADTTEPNIIIVAGTTVTLKGVEWNNGNIDSKALLEISTSTSVSLIGCRSEVPVVTTAGQKAVWSFPQTNAIIIGCEIAAPICSGGGTLIGVSAGTNGRLSIMGLECSGTRADGGYLLPYSGSNLDMVTGLVLGGNFRSDLRTILGNVEMPSFNANLLTADELQSRGDTSPTLVVTDPRYQYFNQTLTANRTITLPNTGVTPGLEFHVVRYASTPGAFTLQVVDPLSAKNYTFASGTRGFARYRAASSGEWLLVEAGTFP